MPMKKIFAALLILLLIAACGKRVATDEPVPSPAAAERPSQSQATPQPEPEEAAAEPDLWVKGIFEAADGLFYHTQYLYNAGQFCLVDKNGLIPVPTDTVEFDYSFMDGEYEISFAYAEYGGRLHLWNYNRTNSAQWGMRTVPGRTDSVMLFLYTGKVSGHAEYGFILDLNSLELTDFTTELQGEGPLAQRWAFNFDMSRAVSWVSGEAGYECFVWDLESGTCRGLSEMAGAELSDPVFVTNEIGRAHV